MKKIYQLPIMIIASGFLLISCGTQKNRIKKLNTVESLDKDRKVKYKRYEYSHEKKPGWTSSNYFSVDKKRGEVTRTYYFFNSGATQFTYFHYDDNGKEQGLKVQEAKSQAFLQAMVEISRIISTSVANEVLSSYQNSQQKNPPDKISLQQEIQTAISTSSLSGFFPTETYYEVKDDISDLSKPKQIHVYSLYSISKTAFQKVLQDASKKLKKYNEELVLAGIKKLIDEMDFQTKAPEDFNP